MWPLSILKNLTTNLVSPQQSKEFYLRDDLNTFISIQLDQIDPLKLLMVEGALPHTKEDIKATKKTEKIMSSMGEVISFSIDLIANKMMQGYTLITRDSDSVDELSCTEVLEDNNSMMTTENTSNIVTQKGNNDEHNKLHQDNMKVNKGLLKTDHSNEDVVEKTFKLTNFQQKDIEIITNKAAKYNIEYEIIHDKIQASGTQTAIFEFTLWLYEFLNMTVSMKRHDFANEEVSISTFHRVHKEDIINKAKELNITCDFRYHIILMTGLSQSLKEFKNYLYEVETLAKKALYPKYWDLGDQSVYSEIQVCPRSTEFEEIDYRAKLSLPGIKIVKLTRIQNNYLMTQYITNLNMRQEVRKGSLNRHMLFHGTRELDPKRIYQSYDTGFDLQYASQSGLYGKGLYFAQNASYSHNYHFAAKKTYQIILADVFVGKSCLLTGQNNSHLIKAPEGYDSVLSDKEFFIIYNNFHSYPLYLIDYNTTEVPATINTPGSIRKVVSTFLGISNGNNSTAIPQHDETENIANPAYSQNLSPIALKRVQDELIDLRADQSLD